MADDRAQLEAWIAATQKNQRRLTIGIAIAACIAAVVLAIDRTAGMLALICVVIVAFFGFWIMSSHITEWTSRIDELDRPRPVGRAGRKR